MKLPTSDKTSTFGIKPHIKRGYYPGKLLKVELFKNKDGTAKIGKYGKQLIFEFAVYKPDTETDAPICPMTYITDEKLETKDDVRISKFVYFMYKKTDENDKWVNEEFQTAITPNSAMTKLLQALGWTFSTEDVDPEKFIGKWVVLNLDDYTHGEGDDKYVASTIKDVSEYEGPEVTDIKNVTSSKSPEKVEKQVKHESVEENIADAEKTAEQVPVIEEDVEKLKAKIESMKKMKEEGLLTEDGLNQAVEQLEAKIEELAKK